MKARYKSSMVVSLMLASVVGAASNLDLSKSNIYRLTYPGDLASPMQVQALLAELDRMGAADAVQLKRWLPANFKRFGIAGERVKKVVILPRGRGMPETGIILLTQMDDEAAAIAVTVKGSKSNSSE